jgi:hypothetical protein
MDENIQPLLSQLVSGAAFGTVVDRSRLEASPETVTPIQKSMPLLSPTAPILPMAHDPIGNGREIVYRREPNCIMFTTASIWARALLLLTPLVDRIGEISVFPS